MRLGRIHFTFKPPSSSLTELRLNVLGRRDFFSSGRKDEPTSLEKAVAMRRASINRLGAIRGDDPSAGSRGVTWVASQLDDGAQAGRAQTSATVDMTAAGSREGTSWMSALTCATTWPRWSRPATRTRRPRTSVGRRISHELRVAVNDHLRTIGGLRWCRGAGRCDAEDAPRSRSRGRSAPSDSGHSCLEERVPWLQEGR